MTFFGGVDRNGQQFAFKIEDGRARRVPLKLGPVTGGGYEVLDGPGPGTRLIRSPAENLTDGSQVKLKEGG